MGYKKFNPSAWATGDQVLYTEYPPGKEEMSILMAILQHIDQIPLPTEVHVELDQTYIILSTEAQVIKHKHLKKFNYEKDNQK